MIAAVVGLVDDLRRLSPLQKLAGLLLAVAPIVWRDSRLSATGSPLDITGVGSLDLAIVVLFLSGASNALNLVDNMDGLAAGVSALGGAALATIFALDGDPAATALAACVSGASLGFLAYNRRPASIFMGDCGSLFLGLSLGSL